MTEHKRWYRVQAIGTIHRPDQAGPDDFFDPAAESVIRIDPRWEAGLTGIDEFSHLVVLFQLDRAERRRTAGEPMRPEGREDVPAVGFFATRTPRRPNPIGISCPRLIRRDGRDLHVTGLDAWDGTPVLDIKGYYPRDEQRPNATVPEWLTMLWQQHDMERVPEPGSAMPKPGTIVAEHETPHGTVVFRYLTPGDAPALLEYINAISAEQTYIVYQGEQLTLAEEQAWLDERLERLRSASEVVIVAWAGERCVGNAVIVLGSKVSSHVGSFGIGLAPDWRDLGVGTLLMRTVIGEAEHYLTGMRLIQLDVFADNDRAIALYRKLGFIEYARLPGGIHRRGEYHDLLSMYRPVHRDKR